MTATPPISDPERNPSPAVATLPVAGLDCGTCAESLAAGLRAAPGVLDAAVSFGTGTARVAFDPVQTDRMRVAGRIRALGYDVPAEAGKERAPLVFSIAGMDCGDCARSVERAVAGVPGVATAAVNFGAGTLTVTPAGDASVATAVGEAVTRAGYRATPRAADLAAARTPCWRDRRLLPTVVAALCWALATGLGLVDAPAPVVVGLYAAAIVVGGWRFARAGVQSALGARRLDMNALMTLSALGAAALGEWGEGAMVVVLFAVGGTLQTLTLDRTRGAIRALMALSPPEALVVRGGVEEVVPVADLRVGELVRVKPGARVPADGRVVEGASVVDQSAITGESIPVDKAAGDPVFAGTVNGSGALLVEVDRPAADSTLARIVHLVEEAQGSRAPSQLLVDRFAAVYTPAVIGGALALALGGALFGDDPRGWVYRALVLLVIACPCALVISTPVSIVAAIGAATRRGVLVKGGAALEAAGAARVVAFDKTGTLTPGRPVVAEVVALSGGGFEVAEVLGLAAAVETLSEHPLAHAVVARARHDGVVIPRARDFAALPGRGARAVVGERQVTVGSPRLVAELGLGGALAGGGPIAREVAHQTEAGRTPLLVIVADGGDGAPHLVGLVAVADAPRSDAAAAVAKLRRAGIGRVAVLTGDTRATGAAITAAVGADEVRAELLPGDKAAAVRELRDRYGPVVMVGDGVNDAPALATADVGVAMGVAGTDVALETADLALMGDDLGGVADALALSRRTTRIIRQNIALSLAVKLLALGLGTLGFVHLWLAVAADMGTSLAVTLNGMRLGLGADYRRSRSEIPGDPSRGSDAH